MGSAFDGTDTQILAGSGVGSSEPLEWNLLHNKPVAPKAPNFVSRLEKELNDNGADNLKAVKRADLKGPKTLAVFDKLNKTFGSVESFKFVGTGTDVAFVLFNVGGDDDVGIGKAFDANDKSILQGSGPGSSEPLEWQTPRAKM